jgi:vault protein inter-alpha-trypsin-like protein
MSKDLSQPESTLPESSPKDAKPISGVGRFFFALFGVIVPAVAWIWEFSGHPFGEIFFDPMPTPAHTVLIAAVPIVNLWMLTVHARKLPLNKYHNMAMGVVLATTLFYSLLFLPLTLLGLVMTIYMGLGLLVISPQLSFLSALFIRIKTVRCHGGSAPWKGFWLGVALGAIVLIAAHLPTIGTRVAMKRAAFGTPAQRAVALDFLRSYGSQEAMLEACYVRGGWTTDMVGWMLELTGEVDCDTARQIYYRTMGAPFNSVPPPDRPGLRDNWDSELGGATTGGVVTGLSLAESRIEGVVSDHGLAAYYEWNMVFKNEHSVAREARMQLRLPDDAVVSRVTLWINGVPQEARFGGRAQTREAYQAVVSQQRDPLLVTTDGPNRVLAQCFPVPAKGEMKIRLGFSVPLLSDDDSTKGVIGLPYMVERNFSLADGLDHRLKLGSQTPLESLQEQLRVGEEGLVGVLTDAELSSGLAVAKVERAKTATEQLRQVEVRAELVKTPVEKPKRVVLVVDRSEGMEKYARQLQVTEELPAGMEFVLIMAGDEVEYPLGRDYLPVNKDNVARLIGEISGTRFRGGTDSVPALSKALEKYEGAEVVWIHTAQPVILDQTEKLTEMLGQGSRLHSIQFGIGADRVIEALGYNVHEHSNLGRLFSLWNQQSSWELKLTGRETDNENQDQNGGHLVRIWVAEDLRDSNGKSLEDDTRKAIDFRLVTPLTGAVVLESEEQYEEAGLEPGDGTVPTVPEPEVWLLLLVVAAVLFAYRKRRVPA